ncbi:MAG: stage II sporulation protein E [Desulfuromonas sp.]|uniref:SpoIIE family protein phosphatase n=1 Tax=Desulfuromonas sp. TaxID=892 RepID=UPI000CBEB44F|nr:SpoIIE family protein phosphatase [Desulfuromonas sp.]PLX85135.1 MAG: stage II sporulation protein E [Desulfuromonas sp.]
MIPVGIVALISLLYFAVLFGVAYYADRRRESGRSIISNSYIYTLSLAVYLTSWTFYGSVGRAATHGLDFLPVYLGPTLVAFTWWFLLRKMVRISKEQNIVSIADFISSRYGKSASLGALVTVIAVVGIMPYIALQLKAVSHTFDLLSSPIGVLGSQVNELLPAFPLHQEFDTAFAVAMVLGLFSVLFGARHLDASERHEGLVAAIALESLVKILAFVAVGLFVTFGLFDGPGDIFARFLQQFPERSGLLLLDTEKVPYTHWFTLTFISMMAFMFLPRQFHIMVIENSDEKHIQDAMWRFPAYMFLINLFVLPIALGGLLLNNGSTANADYFVIHLPLQTGHPWLAMLVFLGGFSASAGMVMVSSVALSTMILNHLIMPLILRFKIEAADLSGLLINLKRLGILAVIFLGYLFYRLIGESYALVNIGLISFVAATQFAPALIGGLYWKHATRRGATAGLLLGFIVWFYTLLVPSFVRSGWLEADILEKGLFGIDVLRPLELFGLTGFDIWTHSLFWTMFFNLGTFLTLSILTNAEEGEREQAGKFVEVFQPQTEPTRLKRISKAPTIMEFVNLMAKFIGEKQAHSAIAEYLGDREIDERGSLSEYEIPHLKRFTEKTMAGSVGAAPARIIIENYLATRGSQMEDVFDIFGSVTIARKASREQLAVLYDAARTVASGADQEKVLDNILELLIQQFKFDLVVIRILDEEKNTLTVRGQKGMTSKHLGESERKLTMNTCIGSAFLTNSPVVVNDTDFMDKPISAQVIHREGIKSLAHAPITIEGQPIGVLSAFSRSAKGIFRREFIELFASLASQIGVAWRNAQQTQRLIEARQHEREMQIAKTIQMSLLPAKVPESEGVGLAGICVPARQVGGDYYDFFSREEGYLDLVIGDVSGHNIGAALIMAETRTFIKARAQSLHSASDVLCALNEFFYDDLTRSELFITMFYLKYHLATRRLHFANAGHNLPLVLRARTGACERLDAEGLILGVKRDVLFEENEIQLDPCDLLLLYTDGITEAMDKEGNFFGEDRLFAILAQLKDASPQQIIDDLLHQVRLFSGAENFQDDVSLVVMRAQDGPISGDSEETVDERR